MVYGLWIACLWLSLCVSAFAQPVRVIEQPAFQRGVVLNGLWQLQGPDQHKRLIQVPGAWERTYQRLWPLYGRGIYTLTLELPPEALNTPLQLYTDMVAGNQFRAYANEQLVGYNGFYVGSPSRVPQFQSFIVQKKSLQIRFEVDNHLLHWSGLVSPVWIGPAPVITQRLHQRALSFNLVFGMFLLLAFFHLLLFAFYRQDKAMLWFGLLCLFTCLYMEFFTIHSLEYMLGDIPFEQAIIWLRLGLYGILPSFFWYLRALSTTYISLQMCQSVTVISLLFMTTVLLPGPVHSPLINFWFVFMSVCILFFTSLMAKLFQRPELRLFVYSGGLFCLALLNDILNALGLLRTVYLGRLGFFFFCLTQTVFLAWRLQRSYQASVQLQRELAVVNGDLEVRIAERTQEIEQKNQELNELMSFKTEMVQLLAHDLKAPLNVLLNSAQSSAVRQESFHAAGQRIHHLLTQMVDMNQAESAVLQLQIEPCSLQVITQATLMALQPALTAKQITIQETVPDTPVCLDQVLFERVVLNILDNAIKHTPAGGRIEMRGYIQAQQFYYEVQDSGSGLPEHFLQAAFDKHHSLAQGDVPLSTGLGLYFCRQVVEAHGGQIHLQNGAVGGCVVTIKLPLKGRIPSPVIAVSDWSPAQLHLLRPWVERLQDIEVYDILPLKQVLTALNSLEDPQIQRWSNALAQAIKEVDETTYRELIDQITTALARG